MGAHPGQSPELVVVADHHERLAGQVDGHPVAHAGHLLDPCHAHPRPPEDALELQLVEVDVGVGRAGQRPGLLEGERGPLGQHGEQLVGAGPAGRAEGRHGGSMTIVMETVNPTGHPRLGYLVPDRAGRTRRCSLL